MMLLSEVVFMAMEYFVVVMVCDKACYLVYIAKGICITIYSHFSKYSRLQKSATGISGPAELEI